MLVSLILVSLALVVFIIYNSIAIKQFGIPRSLSKTYYLYEKKKKGLGWIFTIFMWLMAMLLMPGWIEISNVVGPWMNNFTCLAYLTAASIAVVGTAPRYSEDMEGKVHMFAAKLCAAAALSWCFVVCWNIWYVPLCTMIIPTLVAIFTKTWKSARDYWLEMMAFDATFATIIVECLLHL